MVEYIFVGVLILGVVGVLSILGRLSCQAYLKDNPIVQDGNTNYEKGIIDSEGEE